MGHETAFCIDTVIASVYYSIHSGLAPSVKLFFLFFFLCTVPAGHVEQMGR